MSPCYLCPYRHIQPRPMGTPEYLHPLQQKPHQSRWACRGTRNKVHRLRSFNGLFQHLSGQVSRSGSNGIGQPHARIKECKDLFNDSSNAGGLLRPNSAFVPHDIPCRCSQTVNHRRAISVDATALQPTLYAPHHDGAGDSSTVTCCDSFGDRKLSPHRLSLRPQSSSRSAKSFGRLTQIAVSGTTNVSVAVHASPMHWRPVLDVGCRLGSR
jgi:hypothetical protein